MKKTLFLAIFFVMVYPAVAQLDTIDRPVSYWYTDFWPFETRGEDPNAAFHLAWRAAPYCDMPKGFYTDTALTIYGVAAGFVPYTEPYGAVTDIIDTSYSDCERYLYVYRRVADIIYPERSALCNIFYMRPSYVLFLYNSSDNDDYLSHFYIVKSTRMWEVYFDEPIVVNDTFYLGVSQPRSSSHPFLVPTLYTAYPGYLSWPQSHDLFPTVVDQIERECSGWGPLNDYERGILMIFPIITPKGSVGIEKTREPDIDISPNPASSRTKILSFGSRIFSVEAYRANGQHVGSFSANGNTAVLDVTGWTAGLYVLRIITSDGTTTRKLIRTP